MLYDIEDYETKKDKVNIKKTFIFIGIIIASLIIIFLSFFISYRALNPKEEANSVSTEKVKKSDEKIKKLQSKIDIEERSFKISLHSMEEIKAKFVPEFNENAKEQIKSIYNSEEKQVFLTFDDGPSKVITPQILDILKQENVPATFFVLGYKVELFPEVLKRELAEGHYIANHGYTHSYSSLYSTPENVWNEYVQCEQAIKKALNNENYNSYLFRFPGGSSGGKYDKIKNVAKDIFDQNKIPFTNWNCLTSDAAGAETKEEQMQSLIETKADHNSVIVLMHDAGDKEVTVQTLPDVIKYFKDEGYVFKNFYEIF